MAAIWPARGYEEGRFCQAVSISRTALNASFVNNVFILTESFTLDLSFRAARRTNAGHCQDVWSLKHGDEGNLSSLIEKGHEEGIGILGRLTNVRQISAVVILTSLGFHIM
ncbi:THO complex component [Aspergillus luchuensis]|uniref:THO complex component n=1 Tax=Aspergillus kawachii TaxID=1069201 RepID=A0A146F4C4_ASPKA|nr:THO complex component [Aspergillus luchuensis]